LDGSSATSTIQHIHCHLHRHFHKHIQRKLLRIHPIYLPGQKNREIELQ
jgi:plasmid stabilization system protein ParE